MLWKAQPIEWARASNGQSSSRGSNGAIPRMRLRELLAVILLT